MMRVVLSRGAGGYFFPGEPTAETIDILLRTAAADPKATSWSLMTRAGDLVRALEAGR